MKLMVKIDTVTHEYVRSESRASAGMIKAPQGCPYEKHKPRADTGYSVRLTRVVKERVERVKGRHRQPSLTFGQRKSKRPQNN